MKRQTIRNFAVAGFATALLACASITSPAEAKLRTYYIAAEEVNWDYAPGGKDLMMGTDFTDDQKVYYEPGPSRIGHVYHKIRYIGYTDSHFNKKLPEDPAHGILGPVIHATVGDDITVVFKNESSKPLSIHPHGVFYTKASEGSMTNDNTSAKEMADDSVAPGTTYTYHWKVPERAGPGPDDPSSVVWLYHSHVDEIKDTNTGLVGPIVVTAAGKAKDNGLPAGVDREEFTLFTVMNENESLFYGDMVSKLAKPPSGEDAEDFEEANLKHSINGYIFGNLPMPKMKVGEHVRWYVMTLGTEVDLHTPHWHGNTVIVNGHRKDVVELLPATTVVADMVPDNPGIWMLHCHVNDHIAAGMTGRYEVTGKLPLSLAKATP